MYAWMCNVRVVVYERLSGPFVFGDLPGWAGSYTMDYNTELLYAPMYGSGRGALASAYFRMLMDHTPLARRNAAYCAFSPTQMCMTLFESFI